MTRIHPTISRFFDFYSIYDLYLRVGGFRQEGYDTYDTFVSEKVYQTVEEAYEKIVSEYYEEVREALLQSIRSEVHHFPGECKDFSNGYKEDFWAYMEKDTGISRKRFRLAKAAALKSIKGVDDNYYLIQLMFSTPTWCADYGGKKWAAAARLVGESKKEMSTRAKVGWIDKVMDLHHNTGHLLNKTHFKKLSSYTIHPEEEYELKPLDFRAQAKTILEFLPFNSQRVRNLVIPRKRLLDSTHKS